MTANTIKNCTLKSVVEQAKKDLINNKEHPPVFLLPLPTQDVWHRIQVGWKNDTEKHYVMTSVSKVIQLVKPESYFMIMEGWGVQRPTDKRLDLNKRPSQCSDRQELLIIHEFRRDMKNKSVMITYARDGDKITFTDEYVNEDNNCMSTNFNFFMEQGAHEERIEQLAKGVDLK